MLNDKKILMISFFFALVIFSLLVISAEGGPHVYYGKIVGIEFNVMQVKGDDGRVSVFWFGHRTHFSSRLPFFGDRVRIEYVKDWLKRNAVTRITVLEKK